MTDNNIVSKDIEVIFSYEKITKGPITDNISPFKLMNSSDGPCIVLNLCGQKLYENEKKTFTLNMYEIQKVMVSGLMLLPLRQSIQDEIVNVNSKYGFKFIIDYPKKNNVALIVVVFDEKFKKGLKKGENLLEISLSGHPLGPGVVSFWAAFDSYYYPHGIDNIHGINTMSKILPVFHPKTGKNYKLIRSLLQNKY